MSRRPDHVGGNHYRHIDVVNVLSWTGIIVTSCGGYQTHTCCICIGLCICLSGWCIIYIAPFHQSVISVTACAMYGCQLCLMKHLASSVWEV